MQWIILPEDTVLKLRVDAHVCAWIGAHLPDALRESFFVDSQPPRYLGKLASYGDEARVLGLWPVDSLTPLSLDDVPILSIWSEPDGSTIWSIGEEDRAEALERLCQLAQRLWQKLSLAEHWVYKKVEGHSTIFAGDRRLENLRVAYSVREIENRVVVDVGTLYYARRSSKPIDVPHLPPGVIVSVLKGNLDPPKAVAAAATEREPAGTSLEPEEPILQVSPPEGESLHLFSLRYSDWTAESGPLTRQQRRVIAHKIRRPLRIHGPAGSGKTLVLILKALHLLRTAEDQAQRCHVLFLVNRNALRDTVRTAIEVMDDHFFLASTRADPQYLDVETLHGWCIRELGLEHGPRYVLTPDPEKSREDQERILEEVVEDAMSDLYPAMRSSLSSDLLARLEGDRGQLLKDIRYEISIRIKGKGFRDHESYVNSTLKSFVGKGEQQSDRRFLFRVYKMYQERFEREGLLDTDDVVVSMSPRLATPLWSVQRRDMGYDYVLVDETHLFNENERRVFTYLIRGDTEYPGLIMTFDEAQGIGGRRSPGLAAVGITETEKRILSNVHRSCPAIFALSRDLVESSSLLAISAFATGESAVKMTKRELDRCQKPSLVLGEGDEGVVKQTVKLCDMLRSQNFQRVGIIAFDADLLSRILTVLSGATISAHQVKQRGELVAAKPRQGVYLMTPETCGGLEFDAVLLVGVDDGRVPRSIGGLSPEGRLSLDEEAYTELYTAVTRARFRLAFVCDSHRGPSAILRHSLDGGLIGIDSRR